MILGTAQLGLNYGISNKEGQPNIDQARDILEIAHVNAITILDTAYAYGDSEKTIGELNINRFEVISKLPDLLNIELTNDYEEIPDFFQRTLANTKQKQLHAYLLHTIENLKFNGELLWRQMQNFKDQGLTSKIGYSLYSPKQLDIYFDQYKPDIVQIPMNLLDREFQRTDWLKKLKDNGVEIHVRSVFLQGLLLMQHEEQVLKFPQYKNIWDFYKNELNNSGGTAIDYCLGFIKGVDEVDDIVVGANSAHELKEIMASKAIVHSVPTELASSDEKLIYPFNWN